MARRQSLTVANVVTVSRLIFFATFIWFIFHRQFTLGSIFFALAILLDAVDGWLARHFHQATQIGSVLDKIVDRIIIIGGGIFLINQNIIPPAAIFIATKDIAMIPLITIDRRGLFVLGKLGKITTFAQAGGILWLLAGLPYQLTIITFITFIGAIIGVAHLHKIVYKSN
jgi:phosphatidylglycerophosphate synthase